MQAKIFEVLGKPVVIDLRESGRPGHRTIAIKKPDESIEEMILRAEKSGVTILNKEELC